MRFIPRIFRRKDFNSELAELQVVIGDVKKVYRTGNLLRVLKDSVRIMTSDLEKNALPLSRRLLALANQTNHLMKALVTSFTRVTEDPALNPKGKGAKLSLRQLNGYKQMLRGNLQGIQQVEKGVEKEKINVRGTYGSLDKIAGKIQEIKSRTHGALKADKKLHNALPKVDKAMAHLAKKLYGDD
jgi:hypothetical protein